MSRIVPAIKPLDGEPEIEGTDSESGSSDATALRGPIAFQERRRKHQCNDRGNYRDSRSDRKGWLVVHAPIIPRWDAGGRVGKDVPWDSE